MYKEHRHSVVCGGVIYIGMTSLAVLGPNQLYRCLQPYRLSASKVDILTFVPQKIMKRIDSPVDDNVPIYILVLCHSSSQFPGHHLKLRSGRPDLQ